MTQHEKDEKISDLAKIAIQAEEVVAAHPFAENDHSPAAAALDRLADLLDDYNTRWGESGA